MVLKGRSRKRVIERRVGILQAFGVEPKDL